MPREAFNFGGNKFRLVVQINYPYRVEYVRFVGTHSQFKLRLEQRGLSRRYLEKILGSSGRVSEILNRKRPLSVDMMRRLHRELDIPAGSFLRQPKRARSFRGGAKRRRKTA
jgi:hypothetical protein